MTRSLFATAIPSALMGGIAWLVLLPFTFSDSFHGELIQTVLLLGVLVIANNSSPFEPAVKRLAYLPFGLAP